MVTLIYTSPASLKTIKYVLVNICFWIDSTLIQISFLLRDVYTKSSCHSNLLHMKNVINRPINICYY